MKKDSKMKIVYTKMSINEQKSDFIYWQTKSYKDRLTALEEIRQEYHSWKYHVQPRFQRVYSITKR